MKRALTVEQIAFARSLVIHEDAEVLALNKPAGLSTQGGRIAAPTLDDLLAAFAKKSGVRPRLVHRLDRATSGVILAARSQPAAAFLGRAMMAGRIHKTYLAIVAPGPPEPPAGKIEAPLRRESVGREAYTRAVEAGEAGGQPAVTLYRTLSSSETAAVVELRPLTGRMHQLRVDLAHLGWPVAGDPRYGGALSLAGAPAPRLMLHARRLRFPHPLGGTVTVEAPAPEDFRSLAGALALDIVET
ncbi:MAG TPA: RluA family pseudouridine synthase [Caulobacteraceae bacterium]|nr:RluA family pseudouridine synthase [Caulobacteraceae bacterium]